MLILPNGTIAPGTSTPSPQPNPSNPLPLFPSTSPLPAQPLPAQPSPAQPSPAQPTTPQPTSTQYSTPLPSILKSNPPQSSPIQPTQPTGPALESSTVEQGVQDRVVQMAAQILANNVLQQEIGRLQEQNMQLALMGNMNQNREIGLDDSLAEFFGYNKEIGK